MSEERQYVEKKNYIKFIDSDYKVLFYIPDGGRIRITHTNGKQFDRVCRYVDEYHTIVGDNHFHICEFAERMERIGAAYKPLDYIQEPNFYPKYFLRQARMAPALPTVLSTYGGITVLRLRPKEPRGARNIASLSWRTMEAVIIMLAVLSSGAAA